MNDAVALVLSMIVAAIAFAVLLPTDAPWLRRLLLADLRREVVAARGGRLSRVAMHFESRTRDLLSQINALVSDQPALQRDALQWLFAVLEFGNAVIDLRREIDGLSHPEVDATLDAVARLFDRPDAARFTQALTTTEQAIAQVQTQLASADDTHRLQRIASHLHLIRTALLDHESPFNAEGTRHAA
jgi:uncharacterized membrane protein YccC